MRVLMVSLVMSLLVVGQSLSLIAVPKSTVKVEAQGQVTAAETVIAQSGTIGHWAFFQPPGFPPVTCVYVSGITTSRQMNFKTPAVYPVDGFSNQKVFVGYRLYRRLPDGTRQIIFDSSNAAAEQTSFSSPTKGINFSTGLDAGSSLLVSATIRWFDGTGTSVIGSVELVYNFYQTILAHYETINDPDVQTLPMTDACKPAFPAFAQLALSQGTVNQSIPFTLEFFPKESPVTIYFDGNSIGSVMTDFNSHASGNLTVPAAPMGNHTVKFYRFGRTASATFTIKPRIKLIPSENIMRDQTVNVSLRGYKAREVVRIRWKKGSTFTEIARVTTSSTGSANINVKVPKFVPNGATSVRGDSLNATGGHAQTNAVTVSGGPTGASAAKASTAPSPTKTAAPPATATSTPATAMASPSPTATPTDQPATQEVTETTNVPPADTATIEPSPTPSPTSALPTETSEPDGASSNDDA